MSSGLPGFSIVGLPDAAVQEARERVGVAISNSGYRVPHEEGCVYRNAHSHAHLPATVMVLVSRPWCPLVVSTIAYDFSLLH